MRSGLKKKEGGAKRSLMGRTGLLPLHTANPGGETRKEEKKHRGNMLSWTRVENPLHHEKEAGMFVWVGNTGFQK